MIEIINSYHVDYYIRNKFIDCSKVLKNNQLSQQSDYDYEESRTNLADLAELESMLNTLDIDSSNTISNRRNSMESNPIEKDNDEQYQEYMNYKEQTEKPRYEKSHRKEYKTHNNHNHQRKSEPMFKENDSFSRIYLKSLPKKKYKKQN